MKHLSSFLKSTTFFICSLLILLSLFSYTPKDIAFLTSYSGARIFNLIGVAGAYLGFALFFVFGYASYFFPFALFFMGLDKAGVMRFSGLGKSKVVNLISAGLFVIFLSGFISLFPKIDTEIFAASGAIGFFLGGFLKKYLGTHGSFITLFLLLAVNAVLFFGFFFVDLFKSVKKIITHIGNFIRDLRNKGSREVSSQGQQDKRKLKTAVQAFGKKMKDVKPEIKVYAPKLEPNSKKSFNSDGFIDDRSAREAAMQASLNSNKAKKKIDSSDEQNRRVYDPLKYKLPQASLLKVPPFLDQKDLKEDIEANIKNLETTLSDFGVEAKVVSVQKGPVVTMYELQPQSGVKIQRISSLADDIALSMKSSSVRVVAPIPGRGTVGVEIPNAKKQLVFLREVLEEKIFNNSSSKLTLIIGKDVSGNPVIADLSDMPHLLIAGATGAGKTVCVNSIISSILFKAKPDEVKFIMVDPKMVELASFAGIPHLIHPIISESKKAFSALNWAVEEMERRYRALAEAGCRNISLYNSKSKKMPYIVIVVDELADLMIVARESIETSIQRLAQLSRAVGIHLILATQRPSVDVITGVIKANFPARISFKVSSKVDSRTVLDMMGADKLLGKGDLLFLKPGAVKLIRAQGSYIDDEDIETLTDFIKVQGKPVYEEAIAEGEKKQILNLGQDDLFDEAVKIILRTNQASASLLQRRLRVGYTRAARLLDLMEQAGIVGPFCGSKAREILVEPEKFLVEKGWV
ncbi:MAG: DNA translocase FtsK 4TM domain-containing protein [Candidatus Omnitrophica bacterium]|nr:DNA translocase FtsK 4TM domain-containing protein [Candidatus Omnitrophota bacterium]MDD5430106.1 DNA translocase FtsK 4TM domain-containing protein [Candidatus Omnitrophota bacterium]